MERKIYYPAFEVQNPDWLKFALLYIDKLEPIIPPTGDKYLTSLFKELQDKTDLIKIHRPNYEEGEMATLDAIESVENILRHPNAYARVFRNPNIINDWKNPDSHDYLLFNEKFIGYWKDFCFENGLATKHPDGVLLPTQLGYLYMTLLANVIADSEGISTITDHKSLDKYFMFSRTFDVSNRDKVTLAKATINLQLPTPLKEIPIEEIIRLRNQSNFKQNLTAFQSELANYLTNLENGNSDKAFVISFDTIWKEYMGDIAQLGLGMVSFGLGVWLAVNSPNITTPEYIKEVAVAGTMLTVGSAIDIRKTWNNTKSKRYARKYISSLHTLRPPT